LEAYDWPGNVRELQNVIERALIVWRGGPFRLDIGEAPRSLRDAEAPEGMRQGAILSDSELRDLERENLRRALEQTRWKISGPGGSAELLGLKPTTLASRIRKLGLVRGAP
jgi:transcriptional regulator with GAF, ATPase, and Fis domain